MKGFSKKEYSDLKNELIAQCARGRCPAIRQIDNLRLLGDTLADNDVDLFWLKLDVKTKHFTKKMAKKKVVALYSEIKRQGLPNDTEYSTASYKRYGEYLNFCDKVGKRRKVVGAVCTIFVGSLIALGAVGIWKGIEKGSFYGEQAITFFADGLEYTQDNAIKYNNYVQINIPTKKGYNAVGIIDTKTNELLFDSSGKSFSVVSNKDLSDYANCQLEVEYEPRKYYVNIMRANNAAPVSEVYTVEDEPEDILGEPQSLDGYVFDGWFTDSKFKKPFTGSFIDYVDIKEQLALYPHYSLARYELRWDTQGGEFTVGVPDKYTILTDIALPDGDMIKRDGYSLKGWCIDGKPIEYFTPTFMEDVTVSAIWQPNEYSITVFPSNGDTPYVQKVLFGSAYTLSAPVYKGYSFLNFTAGEKEISSCGVYDYTSDITVYANYVANTYNIIYISDNKTIAVQEVIYGKAFSLKVPDTKLNYEFVGWYDKQIDGVRVIDGVFDIAHDIAVYASWIKVLVINLESNAGYTIDKTIDKAYIIGNYTGTNALMENTCINVSARDYDLTIHLLNVGLKGKPSKNTINCENSSYTLTVVNSGISRIVGGDGVSGQNGVSGSQMNSENCHGKNGTDGGHALNAGRVIFQSTDSDSSLTLRGGDGGSGGNGGVDWDRSRPWLTFVPNGGNGAKSGSALCCIAYSINGTTVTFEQALPGRKGIAGSRGDWWCAACYGLNGVDGAQISAVIYK